MLKSKNLLTAIVASIAFASVANAIPNRNGNGQNGRNGNFNAPSIQAPFGPLTSGPQFNGRNNNNGRNNFRAPQGRQGPRGPQINNRPQRGPQGRGPSNHQCAPGGTSNPTKVPDGGLTFAMLGTALAGLAFVKRKQKRS
ncbi:VPDSG-CTERM sorting domain-containing protein [Puniceicoccaceae bacterium K14]|nr:VPDSG-CTERM sorting domain-containing protein [Puniceicoccaceae bacterium K14]